MEKLTLKQALVYIVDDNFITTLVSAALVPHIYTQVFMEMDTPLQIINEFLNMNLLNSLIGPEMLDEPIPVEYLRIQLMSLLPHELSKGDKSKMMKKVDVSVSGYNEYVNKVGRLEKIGEKELF